MAEVRVGTSGFTYPHWRGVFYPAQLHAKDFLGYYSSVFDTVEINSTFYHLPQTATLRRWYAQTPAGFCFSLKASRFLTHVKKLLDCQQPLELFLRQASLLRDKLGPILFQFPPSWKMDLARLGAFLTLIPKEIRTTFEFRHPSWFNDRLYGVLRHHHAALTIADTPRFPMAPVTTADFAYIRLHGHQRLYASNYSDLALRRWAQKIRDWGKRVGKIFVYFDNDAQGYAVKNAKRLRSWLA